MRSKEDAHIKKRIREMRQREQKFRNLTIWTNYRTNHKKQDN